jgi:ribose transport system substrate-binding protein
MFKKIIVITIFSISLFADYNISVLYWSINIEGQVAMRKGLESEVDRINQDAKKYNLPKINLTKYIAGDGSDGIERQIKQFVEAIKQKPDAIIVQPTDNAALSNGLIMANNLKIPVITYDQYISKGVLESYVTSDNYQAGYLAGEYIANKFKNSSLLKIALVEYPMVSGPVMRVNGFIDAIEDQKVKYKIIKRYEAVEPIKGKEVGNKILKDFPKKGSLDVVFTINDGGGIPILNELEKAKRYDIAMASVDGDPKSVEKIKKSNILKINSAQFCGFMGATAIKTVYDKLNGKKVGKEILIPVFPITKETINRYNGWVGKVPDDFKKPWNSKFPIWQNRLKIK